LTFAGDYVDFNSLHGSNWFFTTWTQVLSASASNSWHSFSTNLPVGEADVWVAFWMDDGEGDYVKVDNVLIQGVQTVPEPSSVLIAAMGGSLCGLVTLRRRKRRSVADYREPVVDRIVAYGIR
jgi:predicted secreted hydrolase